MITPHTDIVVSAHDVAKRFSTQAGELQLFHAISLQVSRGESVAIIGPSGSGKSTLLSLLAGLDLPSSGRVSIAGQATDTLSDEQRAALRSRHISFVFQSFHLLPELSARENVQLPLEIRGNGNAASEARFWLAQVGLKDRLDHIPSELSGGEQQRVAIARAFATTPDILFADEPTGNLDEQTGLGIIEQLFRFNREQGTTLILITHDPQLARRCDRCLRLHNGRLEAL